MVYDDSNIFARILRGEITCDKVYEDEYVLAFKDIHPAAPVHILMIPKGPYISSQEFSEHASVAETVAFFAAIGKIAKQMQVEEGGYRLIANHGSHAHQEVPHFHMHILGGKSLGPMVPRT